MAIPGAFEKPQLLNLQSAVEGGLPSTFCFHVNPVVSPRLEVALEEKLQVLQVRAQQLVATLGLYGPLLRVFPSLKLRVFPFPQSDLSEEWETQTRKLDEGHLLLTSVPLGQEQQRTVALGEVRAIPGIPNSMLLSRHGGGPGEALRAGLESGQPRIQPSVLNYARIPNGTLGLRALRREALLDPLRGAPSLTGPGGDPACIGRDEVRSSAAASSWAGSEGGLR